MTTYYIEKTYFKEDEKNKDEFITEIRIEVFNKDKSIVEAIQKARDDLKDLEIQETEEEIINWKGENVFKKDVYDEWLEDLKNKKLEQLSINCKNYIFSKYNETTQLNIVREKTSRELEEKADKNLIEMNNFIDENRKKYSVLKNQLKQATTEEDIEKIDIDFKEETKKTTKKKTTTTNKETI